MSGGKRGPISQLILDALADGEWHHRDHIVAALAPRVPPGPAYRRAEAERRRKTTGRRTQNRDGDVITNIGARNLLRRSLWALTGANGTLRPRVETRDGGWIRLIPPGGTRG